MLDPNSNQIHCPRHQLPRNVMPFARYGSLFCVTLPFPIPLGRMLLLLRFMAVAGGIIIIAIIPIGLPGE